MYDCYYGDASTVETSVFINAEILVRLFFKRSLKNVLLYTEARGAQTPFSWARNIWVPSIFFFFFFFLGGGEHRRGRLSPFSLPFTLLNRGGGHRRGRLSPFYPPFTLKPSAFLLLSIPFSPFLLSPSPFKATKRRVVGAGGIKWEWEWEKGEGEGRERRGRVRKRERKAPLTLPFLNVFYKLLHSGHCPSQWQMTSMIMTSLSARADMSTEPDLKKKNEEIKA